MAGTTNVLISGANRGIGKGLLELYLARPNHIVIAANRDPDHPTSQALANLPRAAGTSLIVVEIDATSPTDAIVAAKQLKSEHGMTHLDVVIANAGICDRWPKVSEVKIEDMQRHTVPNVYGTVWLYQAVLPLLNNAAHPKWVSIGSSAAMLTNMAARPMPNAAYGTSKVVLHWLTAKMHYEEPNLCAFPIDPGWVQTDLGNYGAVQLGFEKAETSVEDSCSGIIEVIDHATKKSTSGKLWTWTGEQVPW